MAGDSPAAARGGQQRHPHLERAFHSRGTAGTCPTHQAAIVAHLAWLAARLRRSLPARFAITVHYYCAAALALLAGIPVGAWMLVVDDTARPRLLLFHAHVNLLGWIMLTVLGTLVTLWPTVLRTRLPDAAVRAATTGLPIAVVGLLLLAVAVLAWWPQLAAGGLALVAISALTAARVKPPASFAASSIAAAGCWLLIALGIDAWNLLSAASPAAAAERFDTSLVPLLAGFVAQVLIGALAYLLPVVLGGGPARDATAPATSSNRVHQVELHVQEVDREVAPGVRQRLWTFNGTAPGPVLRGQIGDTFEVTLINDGSIDHGIDFHAGALAPDQAMRPIDPGQRLEYRFTAMKAGIWMYHCSTAPMLEHVGNGMYGAVIIDPPDLAPVIRGERRCSISLQPPGGSSRPCSPSLGTTRSSATPWSMPSVALAV